MQLFSQPIQVVARNTNGMKREYTFKNAGDLCTRIDSVVRNEDEILAVWSDSTLLWCALGSPEGLDTEDLVGFFG